MLLLGALGSDNCSRVEHCKHFTIHLLKEIFFVHSFLILSDFKYHI